MGRGGNCVYARFVGWSNVPILVLLFCEGETTTAGPEYDSKSAAVVQGKVRSGIIGVCQRFSRCRQRQRNRARYVFTIFWIELRFPVKTSNLCGNFHGLV